MLRNSRFRVGAAQVSINLFVPPDDYARFVEDRRASEVQIDGKIVDSIRRQLTEALNNGAGSTIEFIDGNVTIDIKMTIRSNRVRGISEPKVSKSDWIYELPERARRSISIAKKQADAGDVEPYAHLKENKGRGRDQS